MHALLFLALAAAPPPSQLPLKTLVLYENGVGYFERRGPVRPGSVAEIPLEPGQLDDVLKSLVVVSAQGVASVEFAPPLSAEAARAMAGLPERDQQASLSNLCRSLTGVEVEIRREAGGLVKGRVIQVSEEALSREDKEGRPVAEPTLLVFGEAGLAKVPLRLIEAVRPVGSQVALAWSRAVGATALQPERERLVVRGTSGGGPVAVGYTTEAPVWRTTYRLVMGKKQSRLQGFALVHNDSDEAWDGVKVTLASGHPTSFLFPLAGPRYGRRDTMEIHDEKGGLIEGVYRIDAPGKVTRILTHEIERPNGILVSPDNKHLFVADNNNNKAGGARKLWQFDLKPDGTIAPDSRKLIFDWGTARGPDGFKMDTAGRFFVAAGLTRNNPPFETNQQYKGGIYILSPAGKLLEYVPIPTDEVTNCAFGGPDLKTLFITAGGSLWSVAVTTPGRITAPKAAARQANR